MLRFLRLLFLAVLAIVLVAVASANRQIVNLRLLPEEMDSFMGFGWSVDVPLFLAIFAGIIAGLTIGFVWEWFREAKHRTAATEHRREAGRLEREVKRLKDARPDPEDEVLAILESRGAGR
ncbi:lipopolysaccharide assembly protein LapA domain-containing protein [Albidovulum sp.]|uniref:lipopolysaccharide assembly protein LapA domain-containing protein n=1 Tax=Albidovulum sp. TaxID=1872424 RepID=UPI0039B8FAC3